MAASATRASRSSGSRAESRPEPRSGRTGGYEYVFPALRGIQAGREFYVTMCPLRLIPRLFLFDEEELRPELRAQRTLNKSRVPEIARYMTGNREGYVFSALTASIDADVEFEEFADAGPQQRIGVLTIPMSARFVINDGQHRRAAIEHALRECPELGDESIAVVLFMDVGLERCQQMFADLNRYAVRPATSLSVLYDHRDGPALVTRQAVYCSPILRELVDMERTSLGTRSRRLFTLSSVHTAIKSLLDGLTVGDVEAQAALARAYFERVADCFPEWRMVADGRISAGDIRRDFVHGHAIALHALGRVGNSLLRLNTDPASWEPSLQRLGSVSWSRDNTALWEGRAMSGGAMSKSGGHVALTSGAIKRIVGLEPTAEERKAQAALEGARA